MHTSTEAAHDAAEREYDAMTEDERADVEAAADDDDGDAYEAAMYEQAERVYAIAMAAEERRTAWVAVTP